MRRPSPPLAALSLLTLLVCGGCRTRPYEIEEGGADGATIDLAVPPDLTGVPIRDLSVPPFNCGVQRIQTTQVVRADLLLIQDRSRSMAQGVTGSNNPPAGQSKWELVRAALQKVVVGTTTVDWGLMLFGNGVQCGAPITPDVPVGPGNGARISQLLGASPLAPTLGIGFVTDFTPSTGDIIIFSLSAGRMPAMPPPVR